MDTLKSVLQELLSDIKELNTTMSKCNCKDSRLGVVDGDTQTVYCGNCDGVIGAVEDVALVPDDADFSGASEDPEWGGR